MKHHIHIWDDANGDDRLLTRARVNRLDSDRPLPTDAMSPSDRGGAPRLSSVPLGTTAESRLIGEAREQSSKTLEDSKVEPQCSDDRLQRQNRGPAKDPAEARATRGGQSRQKMSAPKTQGKRPTRATRQASHRNSPHHHTTPHPQSTTLRPPNFVTQCHNCKAHDDEGVLAVVGSTVTNVPEMAIIPYLGNWCRERNERNRIGVHFSDFMKCQPLSSRVTEAVVVCLDPVVLKDETRVSHISQTGISVESR
ncbi:hypothetical protein Tco_0858419 [Tanacetum coccineum]|uniref:Uncharacterized protein n=1 Tax=Tanacetum coccineum TaxID=301880 RepID=A0ABQ5BC10_9ASTR